MSSCRPAAAPNAWIDYTERRLLTTPVRAIDYRLLCEYTWSANGSNDRNFSADEMRHFLPRYFQFIAYGLWPNFSGEPAPTLRQLGCLHYREMWPAEEVAVIDEFFAALFERALSKPLSWSPAATGELQPWSSVEDVLCPIAYAGGDLLALLQQWENSRDRNAALHLAWVILNCEERMSDGQLELWDAFWLDVPDASRSVLDWLFRTQTVDYIKSALSERDAPARDRSLLEAARAKILAGI